MKLITPFKSAINKSLISSLVSCVLFLACHVGANENTLSAVQASKVEGLPVGTESKNISPVRGILHKPDRLLDKQDRQKVKRSKYRSISGYGNNLRWPETGAAGVQLLRLYGSDYDDGASAMAGQDRPSARLVSNIVLDQHELKENEYQASDFLWQWGQFLDHDIDLTDGADPAEHAAIVVPPNDQHFAPGSTIEFNRSLYDPDTGIDSPRQQINEITAWIDASNVYGSDEERANALRTMDGTGRLRTSEGNFLPFNTEGLANAGGDSERLFLAGDVRVNEQVGLIAMHTLFVREHNRLAAKLVKKNKRWSGEKIYQEARKIVGAQMQVITYKEFLPALLGENALQPYAGYDKRLDAGIANVFSTSAYRFGHSTLSPTIKRLDKESNSIAEGDLPLRDAFFSPYRIAEEGGIAPVLRGLAAQKCQSADSLMIDDIRNFLFGQPGAGGFDLGALNIQRGRDHGLPSYNDVREVLGLGRANSFAEVSSSPEVQDKLALAYGDVDSIDLLVGGLSEDKYPGSHLGFLFHFIVKEQFESLRDGDRFWYQRIFKGRELRKLERTRLSDIIKRNTEVGNEISSNVFKVEDKSDLELSSILAWLKAWGIENPAQFFK